MTALDPVHPDIARGGCNERVRKGPSAFGRLVLLLAWLVVAWGGLGHEWALAAKAAKPAPSAPEQKAADTPPVYEATEVIPRSERALARVREIRSGLDQDTSMDLVEFALPGFNQQTEAWWEVERQNAIDGRSIRRLNDLFIALGVRVGQIDAWKELLISSSRVWSTEIHTLDREAAAWHATQAALTADAPRPVRDRVGEVLAEIAVTRQLLRDKTGRLVEVQSRLGAQHDALAAIRVELEALRDATGGDLLKQDSAPLWRALGSDSGGQSVGAQAADGWNRFVQDAVQALVEFRSKAVLHGIVFLAWIGIFLALRSLASRADRIETAADERVVLERSVSSAFLIAVAATPILYPETTPQAARLLFIPGLLPVLRLVPAVVPPSLASLFHFFTAIFVLDFLRTYLAPQSALARLLLLVVALLGLAGLWALRAHAAKRDVERQQAAGFIRLLAAAGVILFASSLVANVTGNVTLAEYLVSPVVRLFFLAVVIRLIVVAATTFIVVSLRSPLAATSRIVRIRGDEVARGARRIVRFAGVLAWCYLALFNLGILTVVQGAIAGALQTEWQVGAASISVRDIGTFLLVLFGAWVLSRVLRTLLAEEILPRIQFPRGVPDALVLLARYGVLLLGFLLALTSAGVDISKVTLALSALGVGIGFGLQSVVNNFVSGLILVFEHPIQVGDWVEVGTHYGKVTRIGFRASILLTRDGSEVVIPNAELIGTKVTNWSLSDSIRRLRITVPVAKGIDPARVIETLQSVARGFPKVRTDPPPRANLNDFTDSALKFELSCWTRTEEMGSVRDGLRLAIDRAFREAGIAMPFAQADVHLHLPDDQALRLMPVAREAGPRPDKP